MTWHDDLIVPQDLCSTDAALSVTGDGADWKVRGHQVSHCISQIAPETCEFYFNAWVMYIVIACTAIDAGVLFYMTWRALRKEEKALRTMGDAVASFLEREDESTRGMCLVPKTEVEKGWQEEYDPVAFSNNKKVRWVTASSWKEWLFVAGM
jgi:hypothetical protein